MRLVSSVRGIVALGGAVVAFWLLAHLIHVPYASTEQRAYNRNAGEVTGEREVGQTFESIRGNLTGFAFQIATYGARENTHDVVFELRERVEDREPIRRVAVNARAFGDHQRYRFSFTPLADSAGKTYYASLRSPSSVPGDAITVDYQNENPYEKGTSSAMIVLPASRDALDTFDGTLKTNADTAFAVYHRIPLWEYGRLFLSEHTRAAWQSVREHPGEYWLDARLLAVGAVLTFLVFAFRSQWAAVLTRPWVFPFFLGALALLGLGLRVLYVNKLPYTNDEGSYIYDARTILEGHLPGGDALAKAPVVIGAFALGIAVFGNILIAARLVSVIAGLLTAIPLFVLGRYLAGNRAGVLASALWLLAGAPALFTAYGHTQPVQVFLGTAGLALIAWAVSKKRWQWFLLAGLVLGVSVAARKSSLALAFPALFLLLTEPVSWRERAARIVSFGAGAALSIAAFLLCVWSLYGPAGVVYATGLDLARTSFEQLEDRGDLYATYSVKGILPFFRESLPLVFLGLVMLGRGLERMLRRFGWVWSKAGWLLPLALVWRGGEFLQRYEESIHFSYGLWPFWISMGIALAIVAIFPLQRANEPEEDRRARLAFLFPVVWFLGVGLFYAFWIKFHANYLLEFLPALALLAALGGRWLADVLASSRVLRRGAVLLFLWGAYASAQSGYHFEHTGTFHWSSIEEAATYLREHVPPDEPVLTGAVIIPYLSGHHVPNDVAHPTWYGYGFIEPELRNVFMASTETMVRDVTTTVNWAVLENVTKFSYLREYTDVEKALETFEQVAEIENLSNPITILKRK